MINRIRHWVMVAFIVSVPLCYFPNFSRSSQENYFQYASMMVVAAFIGNIWLGMFLALNVVLYVINGGSVGSEQVLNILFGCLMFTFSRYYFKHNKFEDLSKYMMIVLAVTLVFMAMQVWNIGVLFRPMTNAGVLVKGTLSDPIGFFGIKQANGTFITLIWPIVASISPLVAVLLAIPIVMASSSSVCLAFGCVILFYTYYLHPKAFKALLIALPLCGLAYIGLDLKTDPKTFTSRFPVWHSTIEKSLQRPIGYGPDSYRNYTPHKNFLFVGDNFYNHAILTKLDEEREEFRYYSVSNDPAKIKALTDNIGTTKVPSGEMDIWDNPHNIFINVLFQYGIFGLFLFGALIREMYFRFKFSIKDKELVIITSGLIVYMVTGLTHFPLELARTGYFAAILLGAFYARTDNDY